MVVHGYVEPQSDRALYLVAYSFCGWSAMQVYYAEELYIRRGYSAGRCEDQPGFELCNVVMLKAEI